MFNYLSYLYGSLKPQTMTNVTKKIELAKAYLLANKQEPTASNVIGVILDGNKIEHVYYSLLWLKYNDLKATAKALKTTLNTPCISLQAMLEARNVSTLINF
jgi:hypothetical protein